MENFTTQLIYNFGFLIDGALGIQRIVEVDAPEVRLDDVRLKPLKGSFTAERSSQGVYIRGVLTSNTDAQCSRCNEIALQPISIELDEHYYFPNSVPDDELDVLLINKTGMLDLGALVRPEAVMAIPINPICKPDCEGLCVDCGTNLNNSDCGCAEDDIDPRFAALQQLLNSEKNDSETES